MAIECANDINDSGSETTNEEEMKNGPKNERIIQQIGKEIFPKNLDSGKTFFTPNNGCINPR